MTYAQVIDQCSGIALPARAIGVPTAAPHQLERLDRLSWSTASSVTVPEPKYPTLFCLMSAAPRRKEGRAYESWVVSPTPIRGMRATSTRRQVSRGSEYPPVARYVCSGRHRGHLFVGCRVCHEPRRQRSWILCDHRTDCRRHPTHNGQQFRLTRLRLWLRTRKR